MSNSVFRKFDIIYKSVGKMKIDNPGKFVFKLNFIIENYAHLGHLGATLILLFTAVCFGIVPLFAKTLQETGTSSAAIALYRYGFTALLMAPFLPFSREKWREALLLIFSGLFMGLSWIGYLEAIKVASIAVAGIVYMSYPVFTLLFAWPMVGQRPTLRGVMSVGLVMVSVCLIFSPDNLSGTSVKALLWSLPAPISFGFIIVVISGCLHRLTTYERLACATLGATMGLIPLVLESTGAEFIYAIPDHWFAIAGITFFTALLPQLLYTWACPCVGPNRSAATGTFELPTMFIIGWLAFDETMGAREVIAAILIVLAIVLAPVVQARKTSVQK
ncbi:Permease of the drug/metabolite transporter (DMT) superfamily [Desulfocicer vacuolatum DSM 3385]|uniref:Permease of the drug/metabolite transporter (DMT) superfamily n=1 Tax=Desulfocicer vacuolatum DSM 3385 TaxID=1121400 RepID=A0A1W2ARS5_9BACT|nr:DMT family transporter [Desulfocicer vacuolatum]SMC63406.1 Permease of the drug/metabolite transporter (DMT) superfamily [Desulfocicer vacuolatum DSM 3385]